MSKDQIVDQKFAEERTSYSGYQGEIKYSQVIKGWSGSGFVESCRIVSGSYLIQTDMAQINFEVIDTTSKDRRMSRMGSITLRRDDAIKFAMCIAPPDVAVAYEEHLVLKNKIIELQQTAALLHRSLMTELTYSSDHSRSCAAVALEVTKPLVDDVKFNIRSRINLDYAKSLPKK